MVVIRLRLRQHVAAVVIAAVMAVVIVAPPTGHFRGSDGAFRRRHRLQHPLQRVRVQADVPFASTSDVHVIRALTLGSPVVVVIIIIIVVVVVVVVVDVEVVGRAELGFSYHVHVGVVYGLGGGQDVVLFLLLAALQGATSLSALALRRLVSFLANLRAHVVLSADGRLPGRRRGGRGRRLSDVLVLLLGSAVSSLTRGVRTALLLGRRLPSAAHVIVQRRARRRRSHFVPAGAGIRLRRSRLSAGERRGTCDTGNCTYAPTVLYTL